MSDEEESNSKFISLLKLALKYFYPNKHYTIDDKEYKSKKEIYEEWFNSNYINGSWYIGEDIDPIVATITRSIDDYYYIIKDTYRYNLGFRTNHFTKNQVINVTVNATINENTLDYHYPTKLLELDKDYVYIILDEELAPDNINNITIQSDSIVENHICYTEISEYTIQGDMLVPISKGEYDIIRKKNIILQKPKDTIQVIRYTQERNGRTMYGLRFRNILPLYYNSEQYLEYSMNTGSGSRPITNTLRHCCSSNLYSDVEIVIMVRPYNMYSGYKVKLIFNDINGRSYTNPSSIEYLSIND